MLTTGKASNFGSTIARLYRKNTMIAGTSMMIGFVAGLLSITRARDAPDYLLKASAHANQVIIGVPSVGGLMV